MVPAEQVNTDGTVNVGSTGSSPTSQILYHYTFSGARAETWHSQFTYNGFRYSRSTACPHPAPDTITLLVTHAANTQTASFDSSSPMLNSIYQITQQALENNMQSVLTDCPDREKGPYAGDNVQDIDTDLTLFDMRSLRGASSSRTSRPRNAPTQLTAASRADREHRTRIRIIPRFLFGMNFLDEPELGRRRWSSFPANCTRCAGTPAVIRAKVTTRWRDG